jgi:hypothetical protein
LQREQAAAVKDQEAIAEIGKQIHRKQGELERTRVLGGNGPFWATLGA